MSAPVITSKRPKTGGRKKGTPNKSTQFLEQRAEALGVSVFETLCFFAAGDWKALGYNEEKQVIVSKAGMTTEYTIPPTLRFKAAAELAQYLYAKKTPAESKLNLTPEEQLLLTMFRERLETHGKNSGESSQ